VRRAHFLNWIVKTDRGLSIQYEFFGVEMQKGSTAGRE